MFYAATNAAVANRPKCGRQLLGACWLASSRYLRPLGQLDLITLDGVTTRGSISDSYLPCGCIQRVVILRSLTGRKRRIE